MQKPTPPGGSVFRAAYFRYYHQNGKIFELLNGGRIAEYKLRTFAVADLASTISEKSDFTVVLVFSAAPGNIVLVRDIIRERIVGAGHADLIKTVFCQVAAPANRH